MSSTKFSGILRYRPSDSQQKKNLLNSEFCSSSRPQNKNQKAKRPRRKTKKLRNMMVTVMPIVIGVLGTIPEGLVKGLEDLEIGRQVETIQITALLRLARILTRVLET